MSRESPESMAYHLEGSASIIAFLGDAIRAMQEGRVEFVAIAIGFRDGDTLHAFHLEEGGDVWRMIGKAESLKIRIANALVEGLTERPAED